MKTRKLSSLIPDNQNANLGTERGLGLLETSLRDYGAGRSVLLDRNGKIIAGNKTVARAVDLGFSDVIVVPTDGRTLAAVQRTDLDMDSDPRARELAIADNRVAEIDLAWDPEVLAELGKEIDLDKFFFPEELAELLGDEGLSGTVGDVPEAQVERAEELREKWQTERGQLWEIPSKKAPRGAHRLLCGDSTNQADVSRLMGTKRAQMAFTDPPWNVAIGQDSNPRHRQRAGLQNDSLPTEEFCRFLRSFAEQMVWAVEGDVYCVLGASEWPNLDRELRSAGYHWSATIIWAKDQFVLGRSKYHRRYEPIWYGWHRKGKSSFGELRDQDDVWEIARPRTSEEHPTMKPVELPSRAISNSSRPGEVVYEPFSGGGSTLVACEQLERVSYALEIEPKYVAVALERLEDMGLQPGRVE